MELAPAIRIDQSHSSLLISHSTHQSMLEQVNQPPLRILHCGGFHHRKYSSWYLSIDQKLTNGLIRNGHSVECFSYRDVAKNESFLASKKAGARKANQKLVLACQNYEPELLLLAHSEIISNETILEIRKNHPGLKVAMWYCDPLWVPEKYELVLHKSAVCDAVFTTTGGEILKDFAKHGAISAHFPNPVDASIETYRSYERNSWGSELFFAGTEKGEAERTTFLEKLLTPELAKKTRIHKAFGRPSISGHDYVSALGTSRMGLNISRRWDVPWYTSDRIAHMMGNGVYTICPRTPGLTDLFAPDELGWFSSFEELEGQLPELLENPELTRAVAEKGYHAIHQKCNSTLVTAWMLSQLGWGTSPEVAWSSEVF